MAAARSFFQKSIVKREKTNVKDREELLQELTTILEAYVIDRLELSQKVINCRKSAKDEWGYYDRISKAERNSDAAEAVNTLQESLEECISSQQLKDRIHDMKFMECFQYSSTSIRDATRQVLALIADRDLVCFLAIAFEWMSLVIEKHILTLGPGRIQWFVEKFAELLAKHKIDGETELWSLVQYKKGWAQYINKVAEIGEKGRNEEELIKILKCHLANRLANNTKFTEYHRANPRLCWNYYQFIQESQDPVVRRIVDSLRESVNNCQSPAIARIFHLYNDPNNFDLKRKDMLVTDFLAKLLRETKVYSFFLGYAFDWLAKMMVLEVVTNGPACMEEFSKIFRRSLMDAIVDRQKTLEDWVHTAGGWRIALDQGEPLAVPTDKYGRSQECCGATKKPKVTQNDPYSLCMYCGTIFCQKGVCKHFSVNMTVFQEHWASVHGGWHQVGEQVQGPINNCRDCSVNNKPLPDIHSTGRVSPFYGKCLSCNFMWCRMSQRCDFKSQQKKAIRNHISRIHVGETPFVNQCSICYTAKNRNVGQYCRGCTNCGRVYCTHNNCYYEFKNTVQTRHTVKKHYRLVHKMTIATPTNLY